MGRAFGRGTILSRSSLADGAFHVELVIIVVVFSWAAVIHTLDELRDHRQGFIFLGGCAARRRGEVPRGSGEDQQAPVVSY